MKKVMMKQRVYVFGIKKGIRSKNDSNKFSQVEGQDDNEIVLDDLSKNTSTR